MEDRGTSKLTSVLNILLVPVRKADWLLSRRGWRDLAIARA